MNIRDLYLAAYLCMTFPLKGRTMDPNTNQTVFEFEDSAALRQAVEQYRTDTGPNVSARKYAAEIRNLKTIIHT